MSLNKFTDVERGKALGLRIGCDVLECTNCICDSMTFPAGGDLNAHDVNISNNLKVATSNGDVNYTTPDKGQPNYSLHTDGNGSTFWSPDDTGSADLTYNGTIPIALGQHVKFSNTDSSTVDESKLVEGATSIDFGGLNLNSVGLINGNPPPDLTDLENKTQNIDLAGTSPNLTRINGVVVPNSIRIRDTATVDLRLVGDNRVALNNISPTGAFPVLAVFNGAATNGTAAAIQIAKNGGGNNGCLLQYNLDAATPANNHACLIVQGSAFNCGLELYQDGRAIFEGTNVQMEAATINTNLDVQTINNKPFNTYGQWSQLGNLDVPLTTTGVEFDLTGSGVGTLTIPSDEMVAGASWHVKLGGTLNTADKDDITFKTYWIDPLAVQPDQLIFDSGAIDLADTGAANQQWEYEFDYTIRVAGASGTMYSNNQLIYSKAQTENSGRVASKWQNTTGLDMTYNQNWKFTVEWNTSVSPHTIINRMVRIQKVF